MSFCRLSRIHRKRLTFLRKMGTKIHTNKNTLQKTDELDKIVFVDTVPYTVVSEGKAEVLFPSSHDVFYNPVQEFNRDLSIAVLHQFINEKNYVENDNSKKRCKSRGNLQNSSGIHILEALAASGLRSIRFAKEVPNISKVVANDWSKQAFISIERNIKHNKVENIVQANNSDASLYMYQSRNFQDRFDVVDLDPYGTAAPFLDAAVQCVADGGLLMVTCTDMAILCGNGVEACHAKYGAVSCKGGFCHELALRIVLQSIESHANRYGRFIEPVLSLSIDFYVRLFVRVYTSPIKVKQSVCKLSMVYVCPSCESFHFQPLGGKMKTEKGGEKFSPSIGPPVSLKCDFCGGNHKMCGPVWTSRIHNKEFVEYIIERVKAEPDLYNTSKRILGMLNVVAEELEDCPLYHRIERLSSTLHVVSPTNIQIRSAILNAGYKVSIAHTVPTSIKTDAPQEVIWDIMRTWAKANLGKKTLVNEPSKSIMSKEPKLKVSFEIHPEADPDSRANHLLRFQVNPARNWGPRCRATTSLLKSEEEGKRIQHQNKRQKRSNLSENNPS